MLARMRGVRLHGCVSLTHPAWPRGKPLKGRRVCEECAFTAVVPSHIRRVTALSMQRPCQREWRYT